MSDDIVARLRLRPTILRKNRFGDMETDRAATALFDDCHAIMREAADEIERLRLELAIPRDEYAREWKTLLDRIEHLDILEWIRAYAAAHSPSDYVSPIAREVIVRSDKKLIQAADEIERLRRRVERLLRGQTTTQFFAEAERLRDELAARCGDARPGAHTAGPSETFIPEAL